MTAVTSSDVLALMPEILALVARILQPEPMIKWLEGLSGAERVGRIRRSKMSVLRYGLARYIESQLPEIDKVWRIKVFVFNDQVTILGRNPTVSPEETWEITAPYPEWLSEFFDDDDHFNLLLKESDAKLEEVLQQIYESTRS